MSRDPTVDCKVVLLGKDNSGKTSLVERLIHNRFNGTPYQSTIGAAFVAKKFQVKNRWITLGIWDTAGSEKYQAMSRIYYRGARAAIICYDLTDKKSFERARFWINELQEVEELCKIYLCGTKLDLIKTKERPRMVDRHDCEEYGASMDAPVFETSSKINHNVAELFQQIASDYDPKNDPHQDEVNLSDVDLSNHSEPNRKNCCTSS